MDIAKLLENMKNCPCGREHTVDLKDVEIGSGLKTSVGEILHKNGFGKRLLVVADRNTLAASEGVVEAVERAGYDVTLKLYPDLRHAKIELVREIQALCGSVDGLLSVGTGSNNDICRYAAALENRPLAIFATAPSMDGFASDSAPILENGFKTSRPCRQPRVVIADTKILAAAPVILKSAGFGDMIAKYVGLVDWQAALLTVNEYYCPNVAALTEKAADRVVELADRVTENSEEAAGAIMEALVMTGVAMQLAGCSRPASGAEHIVSHFWEIEKLSHGEETDFHGRTVGAATVLCNRVYRELAKCESITAHPDTPDWDEIKAAYGPALSGDMMKMNLPETCTAAVDPRVLERGWPQIRAAIGKFLFADEALVRLMKTAGAPTEPAEVGIDPELTRRALLYHPYMRRRITVMRLLPMIDGGLDLMKRLMNLN